MKYTGTITVIDEEANIVFEKDLDPDAIIEILLEGYSDEVSVDEDAETPAATPAKKKRERLCGKCGKPGHNAKTCPRAQEKHDELAEETLTWKEQKESKRRKTVENRIVRMIEGELGIEEILSAFPSQERKEAQEVFDSLTSTA